MGNRDSRDEAFKSAVAATISPVYGERSRRMVDDALAGRLEGEERAAVATAWHDTAIEWRKAR